MRCPVAVPRVVCLSPGWKAAMWRWKATRASIPTFPRRAREASDARFRMPRSEKARWTCAMPAADWVSARRSESSTASFARCTLPIVRVSAD